MIRIDQIWLATQPMDMRAGPDTALARVVKQFGHDQPHHAYVFTNKRASRLKVLVHDGFGLWLAARDYTRASLSGPRIGMALSCNWITNSSRRWCWVCPGIRPDNTTVSRYSNETPVQMLAPGKKKTHRAYVWAYASTTFSDVKGVVYDFAPNRSGEHARTFLKSWQGKLVCDDFAGYKASFAQGITEIGCMAHARRLRDG